jgi:hypothetical protein
MFQSAQIHTPETYPIASGVVVTQCNPVREVPTMQWVKEKKEVRRTL